MYDIFDKYKNRVFGVFKKNNGSKLILYVPSIEELCLKDVKVEDSIQAPFLLIDFRYFLYHNKDYLYIYFNNPEINPIYQEIFDNYFVRYKEKILKQDNYIIRDIVMRIFKLSFSYEDIFVDYMTKQEFFSRLTKQEQSAFQSIVDSIGDEGEVIISKMVDKYKISRPVYNNLLAKIKECKIATIESKGIKGTHIKIINPYFKQV